MTRRRRVLIAVLVAVVVVAVAGVLIWQASTRPATAEQAAIAYLRALESGDPDAVEATGVEVSTQALRAFSAATELIDHSEVTAVETSGTETTVEVSFRLGGEERTVALTLALVDGRWRPDATALGSMTATASTGTFVGIGDETLPVDEEVGLLPAAYIVSAAPSALVEGESAVIVVPGESAEVAIDVVVRPEATAAAQAQLDAQLATCTEPVDAAPDGCGIRIPWGTEFRAVAEMRFRIEQLPAITLSGNGFSADGGVLVATVTGTGQDGAARTTTYRTDSWSVRGDVSFTADDLVLTVW